MSKRNSQEDRRQNEKPGENIQYPTRNIQYPSGTARKTGDRSQNTTWNKNFLCVSVTVVKKSFKIE